MTQIISNNIDKDITASVVAYQSFVTAETELGQKKQVFSVGMAKLFAPEMPYNDYAAMSKVWREAYMSARKAEAASAQKALERGLSIMNEYLTLIDAALFEIPVSAKPAAVKKAKQRAKVSPAMEKAKAAVEKAKADEKAENAKLKGLRGIAAKAVRKANGYQLIQIMAILKPAETAEAEAPKTPKAPKAPKAAK